MARASSQHSSEYSSSMAATAHTCTPFRGGRAEGGSGRVRGDGLKVSKKKEEEKNQPLAEEKSANPAIKSVERNRAHQF